MIGAAGIFLNHYSTCTQYTRGSQWVKFHSQPWLFCVNHSFCWVGVYTHLQLSPHTHTPLFTMWNLRQIGAWSHNFFFSAQKAELAATSTWPPKSHSTLLEPRFAGADSHIPHSQPTAILWHLTLQGWTHTKQSPNKCTLIFLHKSKRSRASPSCLLSLSSSCAHKPQPAEPMQSGRQLLNPLPGALTLAAICRGIILPAQFAACLQPYAKGMVHRAGLSLLSKSRVDVRKSAGVASCLANDSRQHCLFTVWLGYASPNWALISYIHRSQECLKVHRAFRDEETAKCTASLELSKYLHFPLFIFLLLFPHLFFRSQKLSCICTLHSLCLTGETHWFVFQQ